MVYNGVVAGIGTLSEEEGTKGHQIIETTDQFRSQMQRNYHFQIKGSEANGLIKNG